MRSSTLSQVKPEHSRSKFLPPKQFLTDVEIEAAYGIRRKTLQNWRVLGRGPVYRKFGSAVLYNVRELEEWIESLPSGGAGIPASAVRSI
jgi:hypothetical protein